MTSWMGFLSGYIDGQRKEELKVRFRDLVDCDLWAPVKKQLEEELEELERSIDDRYLDI